MDDIEQRQGQGCDPTWCTHGTNDHYVRLPPDRIGSRWFQSGRLHKETKRAQRGIEIDEYRAFGLSLLVKVLEIFLMSIMDQIRSIGWARVVPRIYHPLGTSSLIRVRSSSQTSICSHFLSPWDQKNLTAYIINETPFPCHMDIENLFINIAHYVGYYRRKRCVTNHTILLL